MIEFKKEWSAPEVTKVILEFDKEMAQNCYGSAKTPAASGKGCGVQSSGTCWSNGQSIPPNAKK